MNWQSSPMYLHGIDLFNHGYYWEAHEAWESLWHACGRTGTLASFLKGLIKLAAAGVKVRQGMPDGVHGHARRAVQLFGEVSAILDNRGQRYMGLELSELVRFAQTLATHPVVSAVQGHKPVEIVFDFVLRPEQTVTTYPWKPTRAQLAAAIDKTVPDIIAPDLRVLFCGINPGLYSAAVEHHFARPGNRFWPTLHAAGFTERVLSPFEERALLDLGYGITNIVDRASASADELTPQELVQGGRRLMKKVARYHPRFVAFLGVTAYRTAFGRKHAKLGRQPERLAESAIWVLPNPSGLNAHYQLADLARMFAELRMASE